METYLIISNIALLITVIAVSVFAGIYYGNYLANSRFIKSLYRDKKHLQRMNDSVNNKLAIRSGIGSLERTAQQPRDTEPKPEPMKIVSQSESVQRLQNPTVTKTQPGAKQKFWKETDKVLAEK